MEKQRMQQVALELLRFWIQEKGISNLDPNSVKRSIGNLAKKTGIKPEELVDFFKTLGGDILEEAFNFKDIEKSSKTEISQG